MRCGACGPACPPQILRFNKSCFPEFTDEEKCPTSCNRCLKVCPGEFVDLQKLDQTQFAKSPHPESISGIVKRAMVTFSLDDKRREHGTSGGFITQFLVFLLEQKIIDGALVLSVDAEDGWREKPIIARSVEEIERATKSKYMVSDYLTPLKEIEEIEGNYAVVGLPCFIHALHKYQKVSRKLRERVLLSIGLFCNSTFEPELFADVCKLHGLDPASAEGFHFRHGPWPGGLHIEKPGGKIEKALKINGMRDEFNLLKFLYKAPRCNLCTDYTAEYADITVGDPWLRDQQGDFIYKDNRSVVLVRTERGEDLVNKATSQGYLNTKEIDMQLFMTNFENIARFKRSFVPRYIKLRKVLGMSYPQYNKSFPTTGKKRVYLQTILKAASMRLVRYGWVRRLALRIAQTAPASAYFGWNKRRKDRYYVNHYQDLVKFVKRFL